MCPREHRAEEELRQWLEARLDALGIDPVAYSRFVLSLLRRPDSAPQSPQQDNYKAGGGARAHQRSRLQAQRDQRTTVVQCLTSAADQVNNNLIVNINKILCYKQNVFFFIA